MSFRAIVELTDRVSREPKDERRLALLEELRKLLNEEKEMLRANIETLLPYGGVPDQLRDERSIGEAAMADPSSLRKRAEELRMKALKLMREADALVLRAEHLERAVATLQAKANKQAA